MNPRSIQLTLLPPHPCPYLPDRQARSAGFLASRISPEVYRGLMDAGFRRSGRLVYRPACVGCHECRAMRIAVDQFTPSKSQRRVWRRNQDLVVTVAPAAPSQEKYELYARYVRQWHGRDEDATERAFVEFLYDSPVFTYEMEYRDKGGKLLGVGICDVSETSLSSVYFYFEPTESKRALGTFGVLWEMEYARAHKLAWYYLGYWVNDCAAMAYKARFGPHEILGADGIWHSACG
jgi:arginine-tRNA-protein transferase